MFWDRKPVVKGTLFPREFPDLRAPRLSKNFGSALHLTISILPDDTNPSSTAGGKYGD